MADVLDFEKRLVTAIADALKDHADLGDHARVLGRRPRAIYPSDCPLLVVWLIGETPRPIETNMFNHAISIGVSWHEATVEEAETLIDDEELTWRLIDRLARIKQEFRSIARTNLAEVPEAWECLPGDVVYLPPEMEDGLVEGYAAELLVQAELM